MLNRFIVVFSFIFFFSTPVITNAQDAIDAVALFKANCKTCHTIGKGDVVGPDLKDFHIRQPIEWALPWIKSSQSVIKSGDPYALELYEKYNGVEMPDQNLSEAQIAAIYNYIKEESAKVIVEVADSGVVVGGEEDSSNFLIIMAVILLMLIIVLSKLGATLNGILRDKEGLEPEEAKSNFAMASAFIGQNKLVAFLVVAVLLVMGMQRGIHTVWNLGIQHHYAPEQPINFPHNKHAGDMKIDCQYCHSGAEKSKNAGIPSANVCMNCHNVIKKDSPEIQKLYAAVENNQPIEWIKVHNLPDHVYFNHSQHVKVGGVECQKCHGPVEEMEVVEKHEFINMGFCINCHRETKVKFNENGYYKDAHYEKYHEALRKGEIKHVTVEDIGGTECQKCHY